VVPGRRALLVAGLGLVGGLEAHGLTDQVVTTNVGTALVLLGLAAVVAALNARGLAVLGSMLRWVCYGVVGLAALVAAAVLVFPRARAQVLLDVGSLQLNQALALDAQSPERAAKLADAERTLSLALAQDGSQPAVLRELAHVRSARFDDAGALSALQGAVAATNRLDAFDRLQIAHLYRDMGSASEAYAWAAEAYAAWGRPPEDAVMQQYAQSTLTDDRARTLAQQAEAAMRGRRFAEARTLFEQALVFEPGDNAYLHDRVGAAQRAVDRYGPGDSA
jgi:tetratricopeptide (TPR) repeat protein